GQGAEGGGRHPVRPGAALRLGRAAHRPSRGGARGGDGAGQEPGAADRAVSPCVEERRRRRRLHLRHAPQGAAARHRAHDPDAGRLHQHSHRVPGRLLASPPRQAEEPCRVRVGGGRAVGGLPAVPGMPARAGRLSGAAGLANRCAALAWRDIEASLDARGYATTGPLLEAAECPALVELYGDEARFRSRVDMARFRFGEGEYKYFAAPLPEPVATLRRALYPRLAPVANRWAERLGARERFPDDLDGMARLCARHGQTRPAPVGLHYTKGGSNLPHQALYGKVAFPLQLTVLLSDPQADFAGGEFVLVEQRSEERTS